MLTCKQLAGLQVTPMAGAQQLQLTGSGFGQEMRDVSVSVAMQVRAMCHMIKPSCSSQTLPAAWVSWCPALCQPLMRGVHPCRLTRCLDSRMGSAGAWHACL